MALIIKNYVFNILINEFIAFIIFKIFVIIINYIIKSLQIIQSGLIFISD